MAKDWRHGKTTMPVNLKAKSHVQWSRKAGFSLYMSDERKNRFARVINEVFLVKRFKANQIQNIILNKITETSKVKWIF